jgi:hypothetical protein
VLCPLAHEAAALLGDAKGCQVLLASGCYEWCSGQRGCFERLMELYSSGVAEDALLCILLVCGGFFKGCEHVR